MKQLYLALGILLQFNSLVLFAQKTQEWHYNLSPQLARQLFLGKPLDISMLGQPLTLANFDSLPIHHHLLIHNKEETLQISLQSKANFNVRAMALGRDFAVQIIDASGRVIHTAKVALDGVPLPFRKNLNAYSKANFIPLGGNLRVDIEEHTLFYQIASTAIIPQDTLPPQYQDRATAALRGYIAFCKPVFRHGDTLKAKIYAARPNGRPYDGSLRVTLKTEKTWWDTLLVVKRGAFSFALPLADTLPLDKEYILSAKAVDTNIEEELSHTFYLEDYQLNEVQYNLSTGKEKFVVGEKILLNLAARTVNNLEVPDASVDLSCWIFSKGRPYYARIWNFAAKLGEEGNLELEIPEEVLPSHSSLIKVNANFSSPGGIPQHKELTFWYDPVAISLKVEGAKIAAQADGRVYQLWAEYDWGWQLLYTGKEATTLPFNPEVKAYCAGFQKPETWLYLQGENQMVQVDQINWQTQNLRKKQSITLRNPFGAGIWYQIGYEHKILKEAWTQDTLLLWQRAEKTTKDLYLQYRYWWGGKWQVRRVLIPHQRQQLQIDWIAPEQIYPGQNLELELMVRDEQGQALAGVDVTAGAINAQFGEALPHSPLALTTDRDLPQPYLEYNTIPLKKDWNQDLDLPFYQKLRELHADNFYNYRFISSGFLSDAIPLPEIPFYQNYAFFAPFVVKQGKMQPVALVYANDTLKYYGENSASSNYNFQGTPGYQCISVRTREGLYQIDSVYLEPGYKQNLILDATTFKQSRAAANLYFFPLPDTLVWAEKRELAKSVLKIIGHSEYFYAWDNFGHSYKWFNRQAMEFTTAKIGPFVPGSTIHYIRTFYRKDVFEFEKNAVAKAGLEIMKPLDFEQFNVSMYLVPNVFDEYEIPLSYRSKREAYHRSGFRIDARNIPAKVDYCLPIGLDKVIKGRTIDEQGLGVGWATIWTQNQPNVGVVADDKGYFTLKLPNLEEQHILISCIGYKAINFKTCPTDSSFSGDIMLYTDNRSLWESVILSKERPIVIRGMSMPASIMQKSTIRAKSPFRLNIPNFKIKKDEPTFELEALLKPITNGIRTRFSDYAFWQPKLITDSEGKARFSVKFPDNITSWQSFAIGMDQDGEMGLGLKNIAAFKPLQAQLYMPRFLIAGDQVQLQAKVTNLVSSPTLIHTQFKQNGQTLQDSNWITPAHANLRQVITAPTETDTLTLEFGLQTGPYIDGEAHNLPVLPIGRLKPYGQLIEITHDTLIILPFNPGTHTATLTLEPGGVLKLMLEDIKYLKEYHFGCNEQTSSKLMALLLEKSLRGMLGEAFTDERDIYEGIAILEGRQQAEGGWSWWETGQQQYWTTNYVLKALLRAAQAGYPVKVLKKGLDFLQNQLPQMTEEDYLVSLETLTKAGVKVDLTRLKQEPQAEAGQDLLYKKLLRLYLLQAHGLPYSLDALFKYQRVVDSRLGTYWDGREIFGLTGYRIADCSTQNTLIAYSILKKAGRLPELKKIRSYFLDNRGFSEGNYRYGGRWNNTLEVAKILEAILPDLMEEGKKEIKGTQFVKKEAGQHPVIALDKKNIRLKLQHPDTLLIKLGKEVPSAYLTYIQYTNQADSTQKSKEGTFKVQSQLVSQDQKPISVLQLNEPVTLQVDVLAKYTSRYVMIEIPIPAGCTYFDKNEAKDSREVHREYHADRVIIFCDELPAWNYRFSVQLLPQFAGNFTLNPVWVEDMYHPLENGTNTIRKVEIRQ